MRTQSTRPEGFINNNSKVMDEKAINSDIPEDIVKDAKMFPYKVNFGRFMQRRMKRQRRKSNAIVTSHYTPYNWLPKSLWK